MEYDQDLVPDNTGVDDELKCKDCGSSFTFTVRDKDFYKVHGFESPKRCRPCRIAKKRKFNERDNRDNYR